MAQTRFLQISDLHLGAPLGWLPERRRPERRRDQQRALETAVERAIERAADAMLVPGDLFDREGVDAATLAFAVHAFDLPGCPPVFIAPGNHDPWFASSPHWSPRLLRARGWSWPAHVHVFSSPAWSGHSLPGRPVRIWGRCFTARVISTERPLAPESFAESRFGAAELHVGLFHGSREGHCPSWQTVTAPFSDEEAHRAPFSYMAAGHYHFRSELDGARVEHVGTGSDAGDPSTSETSDARRAAAGARLAYAGSAVAVDPTETGSHGALEVRIEHGAGLPMVEVEPVDLDPRRTHGLSADVSGATSADQVDRRVLQAIDEAGVPEHDIVTVKLRGRLTRGVRYGGPGPGLESRVFHLRVDARAVRPDYDLEAYRDGSVATTEERFARDLLARIESTHDPGERALLEGALYYGLDALRLREVRPAYEELGE